MASRGERMLEAFIAAAPIRVKVREAYRGDGQILVMYGNGHAIRRPWWIQHARRGGRCIAWDLGYWHRSGEDAGMRCSLDTDHPPQWIRPEPPERWAATGLTLRQDATEGGPVVIVGQGAKSLRVRGERAGAWEAGILKRLQKLYPDREPVFRPKRPTDRGPTDRGPAGVRRLEQPEIADALRGASLVVCRHSNVAVDACIAGVPVVCESGAASALYGADLCTITKPSPAERLAFLQSLAWWNWRPSEAGQAWSYLLQRIASG